MLSKGMGFEGIMFVENIESTTKLLFLTIQRNKIRHKSKNIEVVKIERLGLKGLALKPTKFYIQMIGLSS